MSELTTIVCITCGVDYALPTKLLEQHRGYGGYHHCPNGHQQGWSPDMATLATQRREIERLKQDAARLEDDRREAERRLAIARQETVLARAESARVTKRATAAVCPCCNRSFSQLARHMKSKHPGVAPFKPMPVGRKVRA